MSEPATTTDGQRARWEVAGRFLEAFTLRDYPGLAASLAPDVTFRALLPPGASEWQGRDDVTAAFESWFGTAEEFEVADATVGSVGGRLQITWRVRLRPAPFDIGDDWHVIEQHAFVDAQESIERVDLVCSGFHGERD